MKKYDREQKKWIDSDEYDRKQKKKKRCKNNKEHDYVLILPTYGVEYNEDYKFNPEIYYDTMDSIEKIKAQKIKALEDQGIFVKHSGFNPRTRIYMCTKCGKTRYKD